MNGYQVMRTTPSGACVTIGIGSREQAIDTAETMSTSCTGAFTIFNPCGKAIMTIVNGEAVA